MENVPLLELRNLTTIYPTKRGLVRAVDDVSFTVERGQILGIVGESGCGKSTVLLSVLRLIRRPGYIAHGHIRFRGEDLRDLTPNAMRGIRGKEISMIFQDPLSTLNPAFPVGEQIRESLQLHRVLGDGRLNLTPRAREKERVIQVMTEVGIPSPLDRYTAYPHQFSGGMQQRALIAIALVCEPSLLLADEPTTALDVTIQAQILDLMRRINRDHGTAIILVTHDLGLAAEFCDMIAVMYAGRIVEQGPVDDVVGQPQHPYTQGLLNCRPRISERELRVQPIPGNVPDLADLPRGCAFAPRCPHHQAACDVGPIPAIQTSPGYISRCLIHVDYRREEGWGWRGMVTPEAAGQSDARSGGAW
jgi:oligopeptide/dipeptide ABC transporter ATP-binding protein